MQTGAIAASAAFAADTSDFSLDELKRSFVALFPRRSESIWKKPEHKRWFTQHSYSLSDQQLIAAIDGKSPRFLGLRFGQKTKFAVIDIDTISPYYNILSLVRLRRALESAGLGATHLYQSSASKGWHLWIFFDTWVDADEVNKLLAAWLKKQGFSLGSGVLEIFPSANGLRLPLQDGFAWLSDGQARDRLTLEQALRRFICDSLQANEWHNAAELIAAGLSAGIVDRTVRKRGSGLIPERWKLGRELWRTGLQQRGQRHDAILAVEHYLWFGDEDEGIEPLPGRHHDTAREQLILDWLERKHNGHCKHINRGDWRKVTNDVQRACVWRTSADVHRPYAHTERKVERMMEDPTLTPRRFITGNLARENYAQKRISLAYAKLSAGGRQPSVNEVAQEAGSDWRTVRKHWNLLTASGGDQSPGIDQDPSVISLPTPTPVPVEALKKAAPSLPVSCDAPVPYLPFGACSLPDPVGTGSEVPEKETSQLVARILSFSALTQDSFSRSVLDFQSIQRANEAFDKVTAEVVADRIERAWPCQSVANSHAASLWNLDEIRALNSREQTQLFQRPADFLSPGSAAGVIVCDATGTSIAQREQEMFGSGGFSFDQVSDLYAGELLSQKPELLEGKRPEKVATETAPDVWYHEPVAQAQQIMHRVDELMKQHKQSPYAVEAPPKGLPKCNIFLYDAMDKAGLPLPHGSHGQRLTVAALDRALRDEENFETVWQRNPAEPTWNAERGRFEKTFRPQDGDIAIWNNRYLEHTCLLEETVDGTGNTYYAGRDTPDGLGHMPLRDWWIKSQIKGYGAPDAVYRYRHFIR